MTMGVFDFKSIRRNVERLEQKVEFEAKNPKPVPNPVVWTPEYGYGTGTNFEVASDDARLQLYQMYGLGYQGDSGDETGC